MPGEALLAFGPDLPPGTESAAAMLNLSAQGDLHGAFAWTFSHEGGIPLDCRQSSSLPVPTTPAMNSRRPRSKKISIKRQQ